MSTTDAPELAGVDVSEFAVYPSLALDDLLAEMGDLRIKSYRLMSDYEHAKKAYICYELYRRGWSMGDVGEYVSMTRERIRQMFDRYGLERRPARNDPQYAEKKRKFRIGHSV